MKTRTKYLLPLFCFFALTSPRLTAQFAEIETRNVKLVYAEGIHSFIAPYAIRCFENAFEYHSNMWNYVPSEKITLSLYDFSDYGNAGATSIPKKRISVLIAPSSHVYETSPTNERMNTVLNHEMVHIVALDKPSPGDRFFRKLFW